MQALPRFEKQLNNIIILSKKTFTYNEFKLLSKDLNFCPTPGKYIKSKYNKDINDFIRRIKLKAHFKTTQPLSKTIQFTKISSEKIWIPKETHHTVETFIEAFNKELVLVEKIKKAIPKSHLTKNETDALQQLSQRDNIITKADKGGAVVIIDIDDYIREANRQLNNTDFYKKIPNDPTESNRNKVNISINEFKLQRLLDHTTAKNLQNLEARIPNLYTQPKIHIKGNPDRPVISSLNCHTTKIPQYVDHHLQLHVQELGSYIKDSTDFIKKVSTTDKVPQKSFLVTMDIRSLYTKIPDNKGIKAVETTLKQKNLPTKVIIIFLKLILTLNNFIFNYTNILEIKGCASQHMQTSSWVYLRKHTFIN